MKLLSPADYKRTPWKNGLGHTDQIAIFPPDADLRRGDYRWRLSTARVAQSAPFSVFPEHDRILVVLQGAGVRLSHTFNEGEDPEVLELGRFEPYEFPGDIPTHCQLSAGPIQDFSVFLRKGEVSVSVAVVEIPSGEPFEWRPSGQTHFIFAAEGTVQVEDIEIQSGAVLRIEMDSPLENSLFLKTRVSGTKVLLVQISPEG